MRNCAPKIKKIPMGRLRFPRLVRHCGLDPGHAILPFKDGVVKENGGELYHEYMVINGLIITR